MASIPIHNETDYILTEAMCAEIIRDAHDHFGDEVHSIRVQAGRERHALNTRTGEIRYAFFPQDFGMGGGLPIAATIFPARSVTMPYRDEEIEEEGIPVSYDDMAEEEELAPRDTALANFGKGRDDREEDDRFKMDSQNEEEEDDEDYEEEEDDEDYEEDEEIA